MAKLKDYEKQEVLGQGTYGVVSEARDKKRDCLVALKEIRPGKSKSGLKCSDLREISIFTMLQRKGMNHAHVVQLLDVIHPKGSPPCLVFELLEMHLGTHIYNGGSLAEAEIRKLMTQLCLGIEYCHSHGILHRDLKPQNLLIGAEGNLKICDFGLARVYDEQLRQYSGHVVSRWYRAPEIILGGFYGTGVDMWSAGCIFAEMCNKFPLFHSNTEADQIVQIARTLGTPDDSIWPGVSKYPNFGLLSTRWARDPKTTLCSSLDERGSKLLEKMLIYDPRKRISAREALKDPYLNFSTKK